MQAKELDVVLMSEKSKDEVFTRGIRQEVGEMMLVMECMYLKVWKFNGE